jgi:hypothetical protein
MELRFEMNWNCLLSYRDYGSFLSKLMFKQDLYFTSARRRLFPAAKQTMDAYYAIRYYLPNQDPISPMPIVSLSSICSHEDSICSHEVLTSSRDRAEILELTGQEVDYFQSLFHSPPVSPQKPSLEFLDDLILVWHKHGSPLHLMEMFYGMLETTETRGGAKTLTLLMRTRPQGPLHSFPRAIQASLPQPTSPPIAAGAHLPITAHHFLPNLLDIDGPMQWGKYFRIHVELYTDLSGTRGTLFDTPDRSDET